MDINNKRLIFVILEYLQQLKDNIKEYDNIEVASQCLSEAFE